MLYVALQCAQGGEDCVCVCSWKLELRKTGAQGDWRLIKHGAWKSGESVSGSQGNHLEPHLCNQQGKATLH